MTQNSGTSVTLPSDTEIHITRVFNAPRALVYRAHTDPALIPRWWGPKETTTVVDQMDVRPGGKYRFIHTSPDGSEYIFHGEFRELVPPERLVQTSAIEGQPGELIETLTFEEHNGQTTLFIVEECGSKEARDAVLASGMEEGLHASYDRLQELLTQQSAVQ
jgi:uncharacterized protein YndB with AHSA1/START domain